MARGLGSRSDGGWNWNSVCCVEMGQEQPGNGPASLPYAWSFGACPCGISAWASLSFLTTWQLHNSWTTSKRIPGSKTSLHSLGTDISRVAFLYLTLKSHSITYNGVISLPRFRVRGVRPHCMMGEQQGSKEQGVQELLWPPSENVICHKECQRLETAKFWPHSNTCMLTAPATAKIPPPRTTE